MRIPLPFLKKQKKISPNWDRIPMPIRETAQKGEYIRSVPYPLENIFQNFITRPFITRQTKIITMGSCFAQELKRWLSENGYNCMPHEWGVIYSPQSIAQIIQYSLDTERWNPSERLWRINKNYHDPYIKADNHAGSRYLGNDEESALTSLSIHYEKSAKLLKETELVVWTLGLTELWRNKNDHFAFYAIPYPEIFDETKHEFYSLTYEDVIQQIEYSIKTLTKYNPNVKILLSVSPVPLSISYRSHLGPYIATQYSKSILHAAALSTYEKHENVLYMPSYEITRNDPLANYESDGRHVNTLCIETIMKAFKHLYVLE